jgi:hypothetical protein
MRNDNTLCRSVDITYILNFAVEEALLNKLGKICNGKYVGFYNYTFVKVKASRSLGHLKLHVFLTSALDGGEALLNSVT